MTMTTLAVLFLFIVGCVGAALTGAAYIFDLWDRIVDELAAENALAGSTTYRATPEVATPIRAGEGVDAPRLKNSATGANGLDR